MLKKLAMTKKLLPIELITRKKVGFPVKLEYKTKSGSTPNIVDYDTWFDYNLNKVGFGESIKC